MVDEKLHAKFCEFVNDNTERGTDHCLRMKDLFHAWKRYCNINDLPETTWEIFDGHLGLLNISKDLISKNLIKPIQVIVELAWKEDADFRFDEFKNYPRRNRQRYWLEQPQPS